MDKKQQTIIDSVIKRQKEFFNCKIKAKTKTSYRRSILFIKLNAFDLRFIFLYEFIYEKQEFYLFSVFT